MTGAIYEEVSSLANDDYFGAEIVETVPALDSRTGVSKLTINGGLDSAVDRDYFLIKTSALAAEGQSIDDLVVWVRAYGSAAAFEAYGLRSAQSFLGVLPSRLVGRSRSGVAGSYWGLSSSSPDFVIDVARRDLPAEAVGAYKLELLFGHRDFAALDRFDRQPVQVTPALSLRAVNAVRAEGHTGPVTPFTFSVSRSGDSSRTSLVQWSVRGTGGQPASAGDFVGNRFPEGVLEFGPGETSKVLTVDVLPGRGPEPDESFVVDLHSPVDATIAVGASTGTILNDDVALPSVTFSNGQPLAISGVNKKPRSSTISVDRVTGVIRSITVTLNGISHAFSDDLDLALVSPSGVGVVLMSDAGGAQKLDKLTLAFSDQAGSKLPDLSQPRLRSGRYRPTDYREPVLEPKGDFERSYGSMLSAFHGQSPNGLWRLLISDDSIVHDGLLSKGWSLQFEMA